MAYVFDKKYWGKGFGSESVDAVEQDYAPELVERGYQVNHQNFIAITATARPENIASVEILKKVGLKQVDKQEKFGHTRYFL